MTKEYADRDIMALDKAGGHYCRHLSAMTGEGLHDKSDIAAELAYRDARIAQLEADCAAHKSAEETQIALRQKADEREALKQAEALDRLGQLLKETHFDKAPSVARVVMQVNDAINRVKQEVRPLRLVSQSQSNSDPHPDCELECGAYGTYCKCNVEQC